MTEFAKPVTPPVDGNLRAWLEGQMNKDKATLLAFADDGVIWGHWDEKLITAHDVDASYPMLQDKTLQQAFVFGKDSEVRLFRDELGNWKSFEVRDAGEVIVESQILWGDKPAAQQPGNPIFQRLSAERKGIPEQLIPVQGTMDENSAVRLEIHHLVNYTDAGEAYIAISRLAGLSIGSKAL
ncbi:MAG: CRISPR-associated protein Csx19 [Anaerolineales bacterium]